MTRDFTYNAATQQLQAGADVCTLDSLRIGDDVDYRAMLAREIWKLRIHRLYGLTNYRSAVIVEEFGDTGLRRMIERENGEPLA